MNFERKQTAKEAIGIGAVEIAALVKNITYSIFANDYRNLKDHEFLDLINLWNTPEWKKAPRFAHNLFPHQVKIKIGNCKHPLAYAEVDLMVLQGDYIKLRDGQVIQLPQWIEYTHREKSMDNLIL